MEPPMNHQYLQGFQKVSDFAALYAALEISALKEPYPIIPTVTHAYREVWLHYQSLFILHSDRGKSIHLRYNYPKPINENHEMAARAI